MTDATIQTFFELPVIQCALVDASTDTAVRAAHLLTESYTVDVSTPAAPRFRWLISVVEKTLPPAVGSDWEMSSGRFWVAYLCKTSAGTGAGISIEDPKAPTLAVGIRGLGVASGPSVQFIPAEPLVLTMLPGYARHRLVSHQSESTDWIAISLTADPI